MSHPTLPGVRLGQRPPPLFGRSSGAPTLRVGSAACRGCSFGDRGPALKAAQTILAPVTQTRRKMWDFDPNLHCSIIGTCLTTSELRQVLGKAGYGDMSAVTEHDVHATGVRSAGKPREGAKLVHKALDRRHRPSINRFDKAKTTDECVAVA